MRITILIALFAFTARISAQTPLYFPPHSGNNWQTTDPKTLGWCEDSLQSLYQFLAEKGTRAFIILKNGRMVVEQYMNNTTADSFWYWASAGKTLTAALTGIAEHDGLLKISDSTSKYLGAAWTSLTPEQEGKITIRHQLTMTTGLDDGVPDEDCWQPQCLKYKAAAGTRWAYHNAPYTLLDKVIESATGEGFQAYFNRKLRNPIGMEGLWLRVGFNNVYFSKARSMARYGLLIQADGIWNDDTILKNRPFVQQMTQTSQSLNKSYGYLWWLNGKESYMLPGVQLTLPGSLIKNAPNDMVAALGLNDQKIYIQPAEGLVVVRMGESAGGFNPTLSSFDNQLWEKLSHLSCSSTAIKNLNEAERALSVYPNPAIDFIMVRCEQRMAFIEIADVTGKLRIQSNENQVNVSPLEKGLYILMVQTHDGGILKMKFLKN